MCLLGISVDPYISHKIMARKPYFHIFSFSEITKRWHFILCQKIAYICAILVCETPPTGILADLTNEKNLVSHSKPLEHLEIFFSKTNQ